MSRHHGTCPLCGKHRYPSRKAAKRAQRALHTGDGGLSAYLCPDGTWWHLGHLDPAVKAGRVRRDERYPG